MRKVGGVMQTQARPPEMAEIQLDTPRDLARALKTTPQTVNAWHRRGIIPARINVGRVIRFDRAAVLDALAEASRKGGLAS
jgi:hypothetical protein